MVQIYTHYIGSSFYAAYLLLRSVALCHNTNNETKTETNKTQVSTLERLLNVRCLEIFNMHS